MLRGVLSTLALCSGVAGLNNGLGRLPGLGWNSDYCTNCTTVAEGFQNEVFIKGIADYIHGHVQPNGKTLQQMGYHYVNMDAGWDLPNRSSSGVLQPNPAQWPSGIDYTVNYVHSLGLGFGLYGDRGTLDCARNPGALGHEAADAKFMADHKIDWYKEDSCFASGDEATAIKQYATMRDALNATGHPVWFALCGWKPWYASDPNGGQKIGNSARIGPDTGFGWQSVMINTNNAASVSRYAGPSANGGYWNDGSLMLNPGYLNGGGNNKDPDQVITPVRHRSQMSLWSILALNILITGNLSALNPYVMETWTNEEALAINQDPLGIAATKLPLPSNASQATIGDQVLHAAVSECGGEPEQQVWELNHALPGFLYNAKTDKCLNVAGCATDVIYDGCQTDGDSCAGGHGTFHPNEQWKFEGGQLKSDLPGNKCAAVTSGGTLVMEGCLTPPPARQQWTYTSEGHVVTGDGHCLTARSTDAARGLTILGRRLKDRAFALLFLNNDLVDRQVTCDAACISALGATPGFAVRDVWLHQHVGTVAADGFTAAVGANGTSRLFRLSQ